MQKYNAILNELENRASDILLAFDRNGKNWSLEQFSNLFLNKDNQGNAKLFIAKQIENLKVTGHFGNANCYDYTLKILELFDAKFDKKVFGDIDVKYIRDFDLYLEKRECVGNTRRYYIKTLRAIYNKAIKEGEASSDGYPFGPNGFEVAKLGEETKKRYLSLDRLDNIKNTTFDDPKMEEARRLFLFFYYCYGISWTDAARLTLSNVIKLNGGQYIIYKREKIKNQKSVREIQIRINEEIGALLQWFRENTLLVEGYLLPIVNKPKLKDEELYNHIRSRFSVNKNKLTAIAKALEINDMKLTSYVSRHTMAMVLQSKNVSREVISQTLGHNDLDTTNVYLDSFTNDVIDKAGELL